MPFNAFGGGAGANQNLNASYEFIGFGTGDGTVVTAHATAHTKGNYSQLTAAGASGVTVNALRGLYLIPIVANAAGNRYLADISLDGGSTIKVPNLFVQPGTTAYGNTQGVYLPLAIAAGADIRIRMQSGSPTSPTVRWAAIGIIADAQSPPCFSNCEAINAADTTNTRPNSVNLALTDGYTELEDSTVRDYGAILAVAGSNGTVAATAQAIGLRLAVGAAAAEVDLMRWIAPLHTSAPEMPRSFSPLIEKTVAAASRLSGRAYGAVAGSDAVRMQLFGFY